MDSPSGDYMRGWDGTDVVPNNSVTFPQHVSQTDNGQGQYVMKMRYPVSASTRVRAKRPLPRLLYKDGAYTLIPKNVPNVFSRFANDFWNTLLDMEWTKVISLFLASYLGVWMVFTVIFYLISYYHGDFEKANLESEEFVRCIEFPDKQASPFVMIFLFSVETLRTIGFGSRYPTDECPATVFFLTFSCIVGLLFESILVGLLLAKTHVPQQRTQTLMFSQSATICTRDDQMVLLFRIGNVRMSLLLNIVLKAFLVYAKRTEEGEEMPFHQHELPLQIDSNGEHVHLGWPVTVAHVIDGSSPFYHLSKKHLEKAAFELIVILEGVVESTGASIQARTSFIPKEILWGHRFEAMHVPRQAGKSGSERFDYTFFGTTIPQDGMKDMSAFDLENLDNLRVPLPEVILSTYASTADVRDGLGPQFVLEEEEDEESANLSPSLAQALDIPLEELGYRNRASSFSRIRRESIRPTLNPLRTRNSSHGDNPTSPIPGRRTRKLSVYLSPVMDLTVEAQTPNPDAIHRARRQSTAFGFPPVVKTPSTTIKRIMTGKEPFYEVASRRRRRSAEQ